MRANEVDVIVRALGLVADEGPSVGAGASGAHVVAGHDGHGSPVVVKIGWHDSVVAARAAARELAVYSRRDTSWPVPTPRLLDVRVDEHCTAMVLSWHPAAPAAQFWTTDLWQALVDTLVLLHEAGPPDDDASWAPSQAPGLRLDGPDRVVIDRLWRTPQDQRCLAIIEADLDALAGAAAGPDRVFSHGDGHTENVLVDNGVLLVDWQSAGFASSCGDLAFALLRAVPSGAAPAAEPLGKRYAAARGLVASEFLRAVTAAQLLILTRQYPLFAAHLTPQENARLREALHKGTAHWSKISI